MLECRRPKLLPGWVERQAKLKEWKDGPEGAVLSLPALLEFEPREWGDAASSLPTLMESGPEATHKLVAYIFLLLMKETLLLARHKWLRTYCHTHT